MSMKSFTMELRVDYDDPAKNEVIRQAMREAAKHVFTVAQLIAEKRTPKIKVYSNDYIEGMEEIELAEDIPSHDNTENEGETDGSECGKSSTVEEGESTAVRVP